MNVYKGRLPKKSSRWKSKLVLSTLVTTLLSNISLHLAANLGCNRFRITPEIVSKLLRAAIWSCCAVLFESEQTPFPGTSRRFRPDALHRIQFRTRSFVPMLYFYSETNDIERSNGRCFGWQQLLANAIEIFISHEKNIHSLRPEIYNALKPTESV